MMSILAGPWLMEVFCWVSAASYYLHCPYVATMYDYAALFNFLTHMIVILLF